MITSDTKDIDSIIADELGKLAAQCERMNAIVRNVTSPPEKAWLVALKETGAELHATLGEVLGIGVEGSPVEEAVSFVCDQLEKTFERLSDWKHRGCPAGEI
jgi:hypothetical protein